MSNINRFLPDQCTPVPVGRGRGVLGFPIPFPMDSPDTGNNNSRPGFTRGVCFVREYDTADMQSDVNHRVASTSTPNNDMLGQMSSIVHQIGQQLAENIISHLSSHSFDTDAPSRKHTDDYKNDSPSSVANLSQKNQVIQHRKFKEPPSFRGDGSDTIEIEEWEDLMRTFVKKSNMNADEHVEEILVHLRGKAKDVVKFWIRNCDSATTVCPNSAYSLLRKHFSCSHYSPVPLADFYTTLPEDNENPYDYWLRLNRAADVASECLQEQGKTLDKPSVEIVHMFIRHCPSKDLALTFRSKPIDKWSAHEVQAVLNDYQSDLSFKATSTVHRSQSERVSINKIDVNAVPVPAPTLCEQPKSTDFSALEKVIDMLEKVLLTNSNKPPSHPRRQPQTRLPRIEGLDALPCSICNDAAHSALMHCREH
ncbi:uncharacterized protein LOC122144976 [Cyprinus carpio]|uniref:Uncharacterized protein LOC122144976 n=1 Tax=Cyprinus carpio TaxID=7962 RepID=A0A9Q9Y1X3_CYPCA|nr:uncharacterized protein LOC122144976 [Cyprinus carpio]